MRLLVFDIKGKIFVKARHFKKHRASFTRKNTRSPETAKFSVAAQRSEQVRASDCCKLLLIKRKVQALFIEKA